MCAERLKRRFAAVSRITVFRSPSRVSRGRACEESLPSSRWAFQEHTTRHLRPELRELLRLLQEVDNLKRALAELADASASCVAARYSVS